MVMQLTNKKALVTGSTAWIDREARKCDSFSL